MRRRLLTFLLISVTLLGSGCASVWLSAANVVTPIPILRQVIGYPLMYIALIPGTMVTLLTAPYFSTPRAANWSSLDDGPVMHSYIVIGVSGYMRDRTQHKILSIDPAQHNPCDLAGTSILAPESANIRYQIFEAPPGDYYVTLPPISGQTVINRFKVETGEIVYLGDYNFGQDVSAYTSSFDALYKFASRYHVDLTRLAKAELEPVSGRPIHMCTF